ncbi:hypothetical protein YASMINEVIRUS_858 [Yasminevirus sp. GU-2018]|uniref:Uncharacterized protein n=1 Tax=Yasminevirus sp. GU-2018 TaxID=2420051 RepID=A0A5K0U9C6_9VIRU|nr:hypothetical protein YASMINEVIRUS_858 [Yasminevirus sp. GU-2018]
MSSKVVINCSVDDLIQDIKRTTDPIKLIMLKKFLAIKMTQLRAEADDPSLDDLSDDLSNAPSTDSDERGDRRETKDPKSAKAKHELNRILKQQKEGLNELDKVTKIKAYIDMMDDNKREADRREIEKNRGKREHEWESKGIYDPRYVKYQKDDTMNNKMMERLNSEIDFRTDEHGKMKIERPFDDGEPGSTEEFARYVPSKDDKVKYVPKNKGAIGQRRPIRR